MPDAVIVSACRTAIGTARKGTLTETDAVALARAVVDESMQRTGLAPKDIDDLVLSESLYGGGVIARYVALEAGLRSRRRPPPSWRAWTTPSSPAGPSPRPPHPRRRSGSSGPRTGPTGCP